MRFQFHVNQQEVQLRLRPREDATLDVVVVDPEVGEFAVDGTENLEARDVKLGVPGPMYFLFYNAELCSTKNS